MLPEPLDHESRESRVGVPSRFLSVSPLFAVAGVDNTSASTPSDHSYQFLIHDRDAIFSTELDEDLRRFFALRVLRTPVRDPKANAYCERLVGTVRRECLDLMIPLNERHLRMTLRSWIAHYNKGRPHSCLVLQL
jgi:hypothetical protein